MKSIHFLIIGNAWLNGETRSMQTASFTLPEDILIERDDDIDCPELNITFKTDRNLNTSPDFVNDHTSYKPLHLKKGATIKLFLNTKKREGKKTDPDYKIMASTEKETQELAISNNKLGTELFKAKV